MAQALNKKRLRDTRILMVLTLLAGVFTSSLWSHESVAHGLMDFSGYVLIVICAIGRIYSTAFIGGIKNESLIMVGPYSVVRNPLYFFSLLGAVGIGLMSAHIASFVIISVGFALIYHFLIKREEEFLEQQFGDLYRDYTKRVPRLLPKLSLYTCPQELVFQPRFLNKAVADAIWWFAALPLFEIAEVLQEHGVIKPLFSLI